MSPVPQNNLKSFSGRKTEWVTRSTHSRVLNTTRTMTTKNARAKRACSERRKERYMTSIVLLSTSVSIITSG